MVCPIRNTQKNGGKKMFSCVFLIRQNDIIVVLVLWMDDKGRHLTEHPVLLDLVRALNVQHFGERWLLHLETLD